MWRLQMNKKKESGQSMVELALFITILLVLLAGTIDLGRAFFTWLAMRDAAQEGASYGAIYPPNGDLTCSNLTLPPYPQICQRVYDNLTQVINNPPSQTLVLITYPGGSRCMGDTIQVDVYDPNFPLTMPFLSTIIGSSTINIHATINDTVLTQECH
jgi:hypothetical protein